MEKNTQIPTLNEKISTGRKTGNILDYVFGGKLKLGTKKKRVIPVRINGVVYGSMSIAARVLNLSWYTVNNRVVSKSSEWINWQELQKPPRPG